MRVIGGRLTFFSTLCGFRVSFRCDDAWTVFAVTVAKGYRSKVAGVLIALGHCATEFPLMFLIYFGFAQFFTFTVQRIIGFIGGLILLYMGLQMFKTVKNPTDGVTKESKHSSFVAVLLMTCTNPISFCGG